MVEAAGSQQRWTNVHDATAAAAQLDLAILNGTRLPGWVEEIVGDAGGFVGLDPEGVPPDLLTALAWAGVPFAPGPLHWGRDLAAHDSFRLDDSRLGVPPAATLAAADAVQLKPLRQWLHQRLGVRLKVAPGVRWWLCARGSLLLSLRDVPLGGFLAGPVHGTRVALSLPPFGHQAVLAA